MNKSGKPTAVGISLSEKALTNLPHDQGEGGHSSLETILQFPKVGGLTPFKFMTLDWNPHGHEPEQIFDLPHFDLHYSF